MIAVVGWDEEKKDGKALVAPAVIVPFLLRIDLPDGDLWMRLSDGRVSSGGGMATGERVVTLSVISGLVAASDEDFGLLPFFTENILRTDNPPIALL